MRGSLAVTIIMLVLLTASIIVATWIWTSIGDAEISAHGWAALTAGAILTVVIGGGLMVLVFVSSRRGYDDEVR